MTKTFFICYNTITYDEKSLGIFDKKYPLLKGDEYMDSSIELNLRELISVIVRKLWLIVLAAVLVGMMAYVYTAKFVTPLYRTSVSIYVNNTIYGEKEGISQNDLTTSQKLVTTYMQVVKSDSFLEKVSEAVEKKVSAAEIAGALTTKSLSGTEMFSITISSANPEQAAEIANTIAELVPVEVPKTVDGSSARVVDYAKVPATPYSPSYAKNVTLGAVIGAMLVIVVLVVQVLMDLHIKGEEDLRRYSNAPVLGHIPHYEATGVTTGYEYESATSENSSDSEVGEE